MAALGDNDPAYEAEYAALGTHAGAYDAWHEGLDPAGITTQDPVLAARLDPVLGGRRLANYLGGVDAGGADDRAGVREEPCA